MGTTGPRGTSQTSIPGGNLLHLSLTSADEAAWLVFWSKLYNLAHNFFLKKRDFETS